MNAADVETNITPKGASDEALPSTVPNPPTSDDEPDDSYVSWLDAGSNRKKAKPPADAPLSDLEHDDNDVSNDFLYRRPLIYVADQEFALTDKELARVKKSFAFNEVEKFRAKILKATKNYRDVIKGQSKEVSDPRELDIRAIRALVEDRATYKTLDACTTAVEARVKEIKGGLLNTKSGKSTLRSTLLQIIAFYKSETYDLHRETLEVQVCERERICKMLKLLAKAQAVDVRPEISRQGTKENGDAASVKAPQGNAEVAVLHEQLQLLRDKVSLLESQNSELKAQKKSLARKVEEHELKKRTAERGNSQKSRGDSSESSQGGGVAKVPGSSGSPKRLGEKGGEGNGGKSPNKVGGGSSGDTDVMSGELSFPPRNSVNGDLVGNSQHVLMPQPRAKSPAVVTAAAKDSNRQHSQKQKGLRKSGSSEDE